MTSEVTQIVLYLRARAKVWREAVVPIPRDNLLVADTLDGAANDIERAHTFLAGPEPLPPERCAGCGKPAGEMTAGYCPFCIEGALR